MNLLQAFMQMLLGQGYTGQGAAPGPTLQMNRITERASPPAAPAQAGLGPAPQSPITQINPMTGKRTVQHFVPVPQPPAQQQPKPEQNNLPRMMRKVVTKDSNTGKISHGPWEEVPVTPIGPSEF